MSDGTIIPPPGSDPNPPSGSQVSGKAQALKQIASIKKQLNALEKFVKKLPNKSAARKK
ncbi:MAG TPA: hypothetical protein VGV35_19335 [Bryobacteraceae bacterium]|nr:hypothetical protein [Bryobacteraceae bacterium]